MDRSKEKKKLKANSKYKSRKEAFRKIDLSLKVLFKWGLGI